MRKVPVQDQIMGYTPLQRRDMTCSHVLVRDTLKLEAIVFYLRLSVL